MVRRSPRDATVPQRGTASTGGGSGFLALPPPPPELQPVAGLQRGVQPRSFRARAPFVPPRRRRGLRTARFLLPLCGGFAFPGGRPVPERGGVGGGSAGGGSHFLLRTGEVGLSWWRGRLKPAGREPSRARLAVTWPPCGVTGLRGRVRRGRPCLPPPSLPPRPPLGSPTPFPGLIPESGKRRLDLRERRRISWSPRCRRLTREARGYPGTEPSGAGLPVAGVRGSAAGGGGRAASDSAGSALLCCRLQVPVVVPPGTGMAALLLLKQGKLYCRSAGV